MKDAYWLGVDYGVVDEAKQLGVRLNLVEVGGYTELNKQISQIEDCVSTGANAVAIGAISADGLNSVIAEVHKKNIPVIDLVKSINSPDISSKSLVSFYTMGYSAGVYLTRLHPAGSPAVKVGWFPGPAGAGWVEAANKGFLDAVKGSSLNVLPAKYGDACKAVWPPIEMWLRHTAVGTFELRCDGGGDPDGRSGSRGRPTDCGLLRRPRADHLRDWVRSSAAGMGLFP